jgi:hypothetical protein
MNTQMLDDCVTSDMPMASPLTFKAVSKFDHAL